MLRGTKDPYWKLETRIAVCKQFRSLVKKGTLRLRKIRQLKPGKQGTVDLEKETKSGIDTVVKRSEITASVGREKRAAPQGHRDRKHPFKTEPLVEIKLGRIISYILEHRICPNLVFQYEANIRLDDLQFDNHLEKFDNTLYNLTKSKQNLSERFWYSAWFQLCAGLITLHRNGIQHTDLHLNNVFYRKIRPGGYWKYVVGQKKYYVPNMGYIFAIADYGRARSTNHKATVTWHLTRVKEKLRASGTNWESYDYYRLVHQLQDKFPFPLFHKFNIVQRKAAHPVEKALHKIYHSHFGTKDQVKGACLGTYHILKTLSQKELHKDDYLDKLISDSTSSK